MPDALTAFEAWSRDWQSWVDAYVAGAVTNAMLARHLARLGYSPTEIAAEVLTASEAVD